MTGKTRYPTRASYPIRWLASPSCPAIGPRRQYQGQAVRTHLQVVLGHDPFYASQLARVWLWKDWPGRWYPKKEAGIDLVAQHCDGTLWAIQAKAYDEAYSVTKADVDKFLSESNRKTIKPDVPCSHTVCSSRRPANSWEAPLQTQSTLRRSPSGIGDAPNLMLSRSTAPASPADLRAPRLPPKKPQGHWAYQGEAMKT